MEDNPPLTIVFVLPALNAGGAERVLITLMNGLNRKKFKPILIVTSDDGPMSELVEEDIPVHMLGKSVKSCLPGLYKKLKELKPAIVVSTMAHMNFAVLVLSPFFRKTKFIVREAITPSFFLNKYKTSGFLIKLAYKFLYPKAARVLSPARAIHDEFEKLGIRTGNHQVLHNPVDVRHIRGMEYLPERDHIGMVEFLCVGRLHPQKGYDRLITGLPSLEHENWHLTILGEGPEQKKLDAQIQKLGLDDHITLAGHTDEPWPYMAVADCLLLPSRWEGLPNVVLESLAAGTPVIATAESGGVQEIAEKTDNDAVTIVNNMRDFIEAMKKVQSKPVKEYRPSLLPASYAKASVIEEFSKILLEKD